MIDNSISASQGAMRPLPGRGDVVAPAATTQTAAQSATAVAAVEPPRETSAVGEDMSEMLEGLSQRLNEFVQENARELEFRVNQDGGRVVILVRQSETGEVVRTIPPEEALGLVNNLSEGAAALFSQLA
ncbi:MAG: flagellar protein FlaG [Haliea sp.]